MMRHLEIGDVADPNLIGVVHNKILRQYIVRVTQSMATIRCDFECTLLPRV